MADDVYPVPVLKLTTIPLLLLCLAVNGTVPSAKSAPPLLKEETAAPVVEEVKTEPRWVLAGASANEAILLDALQDRGITDRNALAVILGNVKQESRFHANICEGGARVQYQHCYRGGYGLIQWTTSDRYSGLGRHARNLGHNPSTVHAQVSYIFRERQWRSIEHYLKTPGQSINYYMGKAYYWLGWGIHGNRTKYAYQYAQRLSIIQVPVNE